MMNVIYSKEGNLDFFEGEIDIQSEMNAGFYEAHNTLAKLKINTYTPKFIPNNASDIVNQYLNIGEVNKLFSDTSKNLSKVLNIRNNLGYIFAGQAGSGKTTSMFAIAQYMVDNYQAIVLAANGLGSTIEFCKKISKLFPDRVIVVLYDECERAMENQEDTFKQFLDGTHSVNNCLFMGATNYLDKIPKTITDRPSRISKVITINGITDSSHALSIVNNLNQLLVNGGLEPLSQQEVKDITFKLIAKKDEDGMDIGATTDELKNEFVQTVKKRLGLL
jgi:SpoVK/Ycf46/Vps4 family AAA+-type ATPase